MMAPFCWGEMTPGAPVSLHAEPTNLHDPGAIRLEFRGRHTGYVPRNKNELFGRLLAQGAALRGEIVAVDRSAEPWRAVEVAVRIPQAQPAV